MSSKTPVVLVVLVESVRLRWYVAALGLDGSCTPLLRSEDGDLARYQNVPFDEQLDFLRHRLCGVVQRGCDRLWARDLRACHFVFLFEDLLPDATGQLTQAVAEHFTLWMAKPPAVTFVWPSAAEGNGPTERLAGEIPASLERVLRSGLPALSAVRADAGVWEVSARKT